ncbi:TRAPP subunit [Savitreella phatthalungensis]
MSFLLVIVGPADEPLYQLEFGTSRSGGDGTARFREDARPMNQFILHSSLDIVDELIFKDAQMYMKTVDRFNNAHISAFVTAGNVRFLLLHDVKNDEAIKTFLNDLYELYLKTIMNPFHEHNAPITSSAFDGRVRALARKYL